MFALCPPSSNWVPGDNTGEAKGGEERNWPPYLTMTAAQDKCPSNGHSPNVWNRTWDSPLPFYAHGASAGNANEHLEHGALKSTEWFSNNFMKVNEDKYHMMIFDAKGCNEITGKIGEALVKESTERHLLGIILDQSFPSKRHVATLFRKVSRKLHAPAHISRYMDTEQL